LGTIRCSSAAAMIDRVRIHACGVQIHVVRRKSRVIGRLAIRNDDECKGIAHGWVGRRLPGRGNRVWRRAGKALVEMKLYFLMPACCEQCVDELFTLTVLQQSGRHPERIIAVQIGADLRLIALPPAVIGRRAGSRVGDHGVVACYVPPMPRFECARTEFMHHNVVFRRCANPVVKRLPDLFHLRGVEALADHRELERVVWRSRDLLTPMRVEEAGGVEFEELCKQVAECTIRLRLDLAPSGTKILRQLVGAQSEFRDDAPTAAAAALDCPKEIGIGTVVHCPHDAVGGDDFGFQQPRRSGSEALRHAAEAAALDKPRDTNIRAASPLDVAAGFDRDGMIEIDPHGARFGCDGWHGRHLALAAGGNEAVMHRHRVHRPRPDEQGIGRVRGALVAVAGAFDDEAEIVVPREIDCGSHIARIAGFHGIDAGRRRPRIEPARYLRAARLVPDIERIGDVFEGVFAIRALGLCRARAEQGMHLDQIAAHCLLQLLPACGLWPGGIGGSNATDCASDCSYRRESRPECGGYSHNGGQALQQTASLHDLTLFGSNRLHCPASP
jgi:hypothetical protein